MNMLMPHLQHQELSPDDQTLSAGRFGERGFASLVVGLILILILALMAVGFAELTRHEQQQSLGNLLGSQAYYAAESGINDAVRSIDNNSITAATPGVNQNTCIKPLPGAPSQIINAANNVSYSCVIISLKTKDLQYTPVNPGADENVVFYTDNPLSSLNISWGSADGQTAYNKTDLPPDFPSTDYTANGNTPYPPVIQFSITPLDDLRRNQLTTRTYTVYLYPTVSAGGATVYSTVLSKQGTIGMGKCNVGNQPYACNVNITGLPATGGPGSGGPYLVHFLDFYDQASVDITGSTATGSATFSGGQAQIDVTGKAQDVLKRLVVRVPLSAKSNFADYAVQAQNICKLLQSGPVQPVANPNGTTFIDPVTDNQANSNPCELDLPPG